MKLTRKQIKEGLSQFPIDTLLMGEPKTLTHKQKEFCKNIALGKNKAQAYREAYDSNAKSETQSKEGAKLMQNPRINSMIDSIKVSIEAQKYLFPAHLRSLVIQQLTEKALDINTPPSVQVKALELIGKMTEVSLFTERKEIIKTDNTSEAKSKLLKTLAEAIKTSRSIATDKRKEAESLLAEITGETIDHEPTIIPTESELSENGTGETPPTPTPQNAEFFDGEPMHSIPHNQSSDIDVPRETLESPPLSFTDSEWGGVSNFENKDPTNSMENTPLVDSGSHTDAGDISK